MDNVKLSLSNQLPKYPHPTQLDSPSVVLPEHQNRHPIYRIFNFRNGLGPYPVHIAHPTFRQCVQHFEAYEWILLLGTTSTATWVGHMTVRSVTGNSAFSLKPIPVAFGLIAGFAAGLGYASLHSYAKLIGLKPYYPPRDQDPKA